jgi:hypothetical protein
MSPSELHIIYVSRKLKRKAKKSEQVASEK